MVGDAENGSERLAADFDQAHVRHDGPVSREKIFGGLPVTRGFDTPNSVIFRFDPLPPELEERALKDSRIDPGKRWFSFNVRSAADLRDALWWLNQAYEKTK